jgi:hypothetical protein
MREAQPRGLKREPLWRFGACRECGRALKTTAMVAVSPDEGRTRSALLAKKDEAFSVGPAFAPAFPKKPAPSLL